MKVVILPEVIDYFLELSSILYDKGYLGFEEDAIQYAIVVICLHSLKFCDSLERGFGRRAQPSTNS
jgi:hypothetical protein